MALAGSLIFAFAYNGFCQISADLGAHPINRVGWTFKPTFASKICVFFSWWLRPFLRTRPNNFLSIGLGIFTIVALMTSPALIFWSSQLLAAALVDNPYLQNLISFFVGALGLIFIAPWISGFFMMVILPLGLGLVHLCNRVIHSTWFKWISYLPKVAILNFACGYAIALATSVFAQNDSLLKEILQLSNSAVVMVTIIWGSINFAPKAGKSLGVLVFALLTIYFVFDSFAAIEGKTIFGDSLPTPVAQFWMLQNIVWFASGLVSLFYFLRPIRAFRTAREVKA